MLSVVGFLMNNIPESSRKKYWFIVVLNQPWIKLKLYLMIPVTL